MSGKTHQNSAVWNHKFEIENWSYTNATTSCHPDNNCQQETVRLNPSCASRSAPSSLTTQWIRGTCSTSLFYHRVFLQSCSFRICSRMERKSSMGHSHSKHWSYPILSSCGIPWATAWRFSHRSAPDSGCHISPAHFPFTPWENHFWETERWTTCSNMF